MASKVRVGLVYGGWSSERSVSVSSATQVVEHLNRNRYNVTLIEIAGDRRWFVDLDGTRQEIRPSDALREIDVALLVLHGSGGEDGVIQGVLEAHGVPYTGPGVAASAMFMDKLLTKWLAMSHGVRTPRYLCVPDALTDEKIDVFMDQALSVLGEFLVVKPARHGSSVGVSVISGRDELFTGLKHALSVDDSVYVEKFIPGVEVQVGILGDWNNYQILPTLELDFRDGQRWFDPEMIDKLIELALHRKMA